MPRPLLVFNFGRTMTPDEPRIAQSVERAVAHTVTSPVSQTFQLRAGREDVRLLVRGDATGLRLVAVCAAAARERVERALAQARFVLAARGVRLETV
ncbi:MAG TPA: hypothetical protein VHT53_02250 [Candidatus Elarobacter sp.]|nr:hypothetical protein [Candidatus Elarobacter sp.]